MAIGDIHGKLLDIVDIDEVTDEVMLFMKTVPAGLKRLKSKISTCHLDDVCCQICDVDDVET